jgi:acetaldehyde dehydrogenase (acetylating)
MPASRVVVNSPSTHGAIGFTTDLEPSMTLGCGSWGGNVTSDNISPRHLVDVKRIAFETRPINRPAALDAQSAALPSGDRPAARAATGGATVDRAAIAALVDRFLADRQAHQPLPQSPASQPAAARPAISSPPEPRTEARPVQRTTEQPAQPLSANATANGRVYDFVCEEDVRRALNAKQKILINARTIITPAARELGEEREVFTRG